MVMSTKNLARTVIEGGRYATNGWMRRRSNHKHRAQVRAVLGGVGRTGELDDLIVPGRKRVGREFDDKLGAPLRWLQSNVGRPWAVVRAELFETFDTRTTAGRHIVFGHMLPWVEDVGRYSCARFVVDRRGLLRRKAEVRWRWEVPAPLPEPEHALLRWLESRRVGAHGSTLFWFVPTPGGFFRQHHRLSDQDANRWRALPTWFQQRHSPSAPPMPPEKPMFADRVRN
jgi:hypothetical protein